MSVAALRLAGATWLACNFAALPLPVLNVPFALHILVLPAWS